MFNFFKKKDASGTQDSTIKLNLSGLHCSSCAVNIDLALEDLKGIVSSKTDYARSTSIVQFQSHIVTEKAIILHIKGLGYEAVISE